MHLWVREEIAQIAENMDVDLKPSSITYSVNLGKSLNLWFPYIQKGDDNNGKHVVLLM